VTGPRASPSGSSEGEGLHAESQRRNEFYSRMIRGGAVEHFVSKAGAPTIIYPHVHVIHQNGGDVDVVASARPASHVWRITLRNPSGNEVNSAIRQAQSYL
jgi:hypothetical protein